ncbi:MAG: hypothetical protein OEQ39_03155 [Gammaproteobacteria bacterium]|nr:hypothetical protein [Gammaproteobacteria bacterium]MDH3468316.1 hypothetical protein [Gammaproteobacteria bacterium]
MSTPFPTHELMTENIAICAYLGYRETDRGTEAGYRRAYMSKCSGTSD